MDRLLNRTVKIYYNCTHLTANIKHLKVQTSISDCLLKIFIFTGYTSVSQIRTSQAPSYLTTKNPKRIVFLMYLLASEIQSPDVSDAQCSFIRRSQVK